MAGELAKIARAAERLHVIAFLPANPARPAASCSSGSHDGSGRGRIQGSMGFTTEQREFASSQCLDSIRTGSARGDSVPDMMAEIPGQLTDNWLPTYPSIARQIIKMPVMRGNASITP
jgi:hypothetical protein